MKRPLGALLGGLCAVACAPSAEPGPPSARLRGHLVLGHEVRTFQPCGEERLLWVLPTPELRQAYDALSPAAYAPVYVELRGVLGTPPATGFGEDTAGQLEVLELNRAASLAESHGCAEDLTGVAFRAAGNEPFWHIEVGWDAIVLSRLGSPDLVLPLEPPVASGVGWIYETETLEPEPHSLRLALEEGRCSDTMVGTRTAWQARMELDGETWEGCAWEGDAAP